jgi:hypothetical protein
MGFNEALIFGPLSLISFIIGGFFAIRAIYKLLDWRNGNEDAIWNLIAYGVAGGGVLWFAIGCMPWYIESMQVFGQDFFNIPALFVLILGNVAIWLTTYRYFLKWRTSKQSTFTFFFI